MSYTQAPSYLNHLEVTYKNTVEALWKSDTVCYSGNNKKEVQTRSCRCDFQNDGVWWLVEFPQTMKLIQGQSEN